MDYKKSEGGLFWEVRSGFLPHGRVFLPGTVETSALEDIKQALVNAEDTGYEKARQRAIFLLDNWKNDKRRP